MSKHTPGPWSTYGAAHQHVRTNGEDSEFRLYKISNPADARLIAAAPELLEALKIAEDVLMEEYGPDFTHPHADTIRKAIAKAEGK